MSLLKPSTLEEVVVKFLSEGEKSTATLLTKIRESGRDITKQGFYKALRKLKGEEIILVYRKIVSLDTVWIKKMGDLFEEITKAHALRRDSFDIVGLDDRESMTYLFSNAKNLDTFWGYIQSILIHKIEPCEPIFSYDPHYWFYIARKEREQELLKEMVEHKRQFLMTVGGTTPLDKVVRQDFNNDYLQYNYKKMFDAPNYYITLLSDYIIEVTLDISVSTEIENIYQNEKVITAEIINSLDKLLLSKGRNKIKISRNRKRAVLLRKKFQKDFYKLREK